MNRYNRSQIEHTLATFRHRNDNIQKETNMNLADASQCQRFVTMLTKCTEAETRNPGVLREWEREFVESLREKFNTREDALDLGVTPWSPTLKQWNELHNIASKVW